MHLVRSLAYFHSEEYEALRSSGCVVGLTIGNFDGIHLGHQLLFRELDSALKSTDEFAKNHDQRLYKILMTFWPHPRQFLSGVSRRELSAHEEFFVLTPLRKKIELVREAGFDCFCLLRFDSHFAALSPATFLKDYLEEGIRPSVVVVGDDWAFGRGRAGNLATLQHSGVTAGFKVRIVSALTGSDSARVSSRLVKQKLAEGRVEVLESLLGRLFSVSGHVRAGDKRGRQLGFPTANLAFVSQLLPPNGVYATRSRLADKTYDSVTNIGVRPTFSGATRLVETHLLSGPEREFYGERLEVEFLARLRDEQKFADVSSLKAAIERDVRQARSIFSR